MKLLEILRQNRLMKTLEEVKNFESTLAELANNFNEQDLAEYHLILDDQCQQPEVMFSLIHFLESFEVERQIEAFIKIIPQLMINAPEWTRILHNRILNDELACKIYQNKLHSINAEKSHFIYYLLEESVKNYLQTESNNLLIAN